MLNIPQEKLTAIKNFAHQYIFKLLCQQDIPFSSLISTRS